MAKDENVLGAPTEGLGQKVTFAPGVVGAPQQDSGGMSGLRADVVGGAVQDRTMAQGVRDPGFDPTTGFLMQIAGAALAPKLNQIKQDKYIEGMQRAMQGEAIQDIAESQPWYSRIFGGADVVEGARSYLGHTKAQEAIAAMEDKMPDLRKMEPADARKFFTDSVTANMTGDKAADIAIMKSLTEAMPSVMKRQAKEHFAYKQEQASIAESASFKAGSSRLQAAGKALAEGTVSQDDFNALAASWIGSVAPAQGRDMESYGKARTADLISLAGDGQFHAIQAWLHGGGQALLTPEQAKQVDSAIQAGESKQKNRYSFEWNDRLTDIKVRAARPPEGETPGKLLAEVDAMNDSYRKTTGSSLGIFSPDERTAIAERSAIAIANAHEKEANRAAANADKARTDADKAAAEAQKQSTILTMAAAGNLHLIDITPGYSADLVNSTVVSALRTMTPEQQNGVLQRNFLQGKRVIPTISQERDAHVITAVSAVGDSGSFGPGVEKAYQEWLGLRNVSKETAAAYYPKMGGQMEQFHGLIESLGPEAAPAAFREAFLKNPSPLKLDKKEVAKATSEITSHYNEWTPGILGGMKLRPESADVLVNHFEPAIAEMASRMHGDIGTATKLVLAQNAGGHETLGGYAWLKDKSQTPLTTYLTKTGPRGQVALGQDTLDDVVRMGIDQTLTTVMPSRSAKYVNVVRVADKGGVPQMIVFGIDSDGKQFHAPLDGGQLFDLYHKHRADLKSPDLAPDFSRAMQ